MTNYADLIEQANRVVSNASTVVPVSLIPGYKYVQAVEIIAEEAAREGYIRPEDVSRLIKFRNNPSDESWANL